MDPPDVRNSSLERNVSYRASDGRSMRWWSGSNAAPESRGVFVYANLPPSVNHVHRSRWNVHVISYIQPRAAFFLLKPPDVFSSCMDGCEDRAVPASRRPEDQHAGQGLPVAAQADDGWCRPGAICRCQCGTAHDWARITTWNGLGRGGWYFVHARARERRLRCATSGSGLRFDKLAADTGKTMTRFRGAQQPRKLESLASFAESWRPQRTVRQRQSQPILASATGPVAGFDGPLLFGLPLQSYAFCLAKAVGWQGNTTCRVSHVGSNKLAPCPLACGDRCRRYMPAAFPRPRPTKIETINIARGTGQGIWGLVRWRRSGRCAPPSPSHLHLPAANKLPFGEPGLSRGATPV